MRPALLVLAAAFLSCGDAVPDVASLESPLEAYCTATVVDRGVKDVETDYLPHVIACENGGGGAASLEAFAVVARSRLYYRLAASGSIRDGTADAVYTCGREPGQQHRDAARATSGLVLRYADTTVVGFFVGGALQSPPACTGGTDDRTGTERFVTYNEGKSGDAVTQTNLGWVSPSNFANRGCYSDNGSNCLALAGRRYDEILRFYFGEDIGIVRAEGSCVVAPPADAGVDAGEGDDAGAGDVGDAGFDAGVGADAATPSDGGTGGIEAAGCGCAGAGPGGPVLLLALLLHRVRRCRP